MFRHQKQLCVKSNIKYFGNIFSYSFSTYTHGQFGNLKKKKKFFCFLENRPGGRDGGRTLGHKWSQMAYGRRADLKSVRRPWKSAAGIRPTISLRSPPRLVKTSFNNKAHDCIHCLNVVSPVGGEYESDLEGHSIRLPGLVIYIISLQFFCQITV